MANDYQVGKGRPPLHSRFRPGQSGNPKGRPKGTKRIGDLLGKILSRKVTVREGGSVREVAVLEAVFMTIAGNAMKGDHRAAAFLLNALETYHGNSEQVGFSRSTLEDAKKELHARLEAMAARMRQQEPDP